MVDFDLRGNTLLVDSFSFDGDVASPIKIGGSPTGHVIDLDDVTLAADKSAIHAGSFSSPLQYAGTTDILTQFHGQSAGNGGGFDYCIFSSMKGADSTDNLIGIHNTTHVPALTGSAPKTVQAGQFHALLDDTTSKLATRGGDNTAGMYAGWFKVGSVVGSELEAGSYAAAIWLDNQLNGTKNGTTYSIYSSSGATSDAWAGFADDAAGWTNLLKFEGTDTPPVSSGGSGDITFSGTWKKIAIDVNGTTLYLVASASPS